MRRALHALLPMLLLAAAVLLSACNLSQSENIPTPTTVGGQLPAVTITFPREGDTLAVNQGITVLATASDGVGITRVQLIANGQPIGSVVSQNSGGDRVFPVSLAYTPTQLGPVTLQVIAFRGSVASLPGSVNATVAVPPSATPAPQPTRAPVTQAPVVDPFDPTCRLLTNAALNLRTGPGTEYPRLLVLNPGTVVPITGRTGSNTWWQVRFGATSGWVSNQFVTLYGNCSGVIVPPIPPTPTGPVSATPLPTATPTRIPDTQVPPTATASLPDLLVPSIAGPTSLTLGAGNAPVRAVYSVTIFNNGGSITGQFNNTIAVSPGLIEPLSVLAGLGPGQTIALTKELTFSAPGTYTLTIRADSDAQIVEISEVNNLGFYTVTVTAPPA